MDQIQNRNDMPVEEQEIDLVELARKLWLNRGLIIKVACGFMAFGLAVALLSAKVYTATCDFVPQTSNSSGSSRMSSLAALAGININQMQDVKTLSPYVYEKIMNSATFGKELMMTEIDYRKAGRPVSFYEYNTSEEFNKPSVGGYILKYTVGLPSLVLNALRGDKSEPDYVASAASEGVTRIEMLTEKEYECLNALRRSLVLSIDDKNGYLTLSANMAEPLAAAQLAQATLALLQRYITEFKIEKVQSNLDFVQERYDEAKSHFEDVQARRAKFRDASHADAYHQLLPGGVGCRGGRADDAGPAGPQRQPRAGEARCRVFAGDESLQRAGDAAGAGQDKREGDHSYPYGGEPRDGSLSEE